MLIGNCACLHEQVDNTQHIIHYGNAVKYTTLLLILQ